ncbi:hypothetical protein FBZ82_11962 [Azospirillum brasilense]|uniref:Uncharacterized protein n=1 Tax=Azospirillum brasilense TaxID=192 RepID=A0A4D8R585_AZOBR|nr:MULTISPECIES: hypothetical protein [Azospirillum]MBB3267974.1 hypothetical protein [Azospirillum sp. OGB3]QCO15876.1 hypothetical protein D3869_11915 [Azospirillum brasilense]TWA60778.1 hypothetical protein FBZ82_11962 [Azospirillum brasilense]
MLIATTTEQITSSSRVHIALVDEFIQLAQNRIDGQNDPFVRESLADLLSTLREERSGYLDLLNAAMPAKAA